MKYTRIMYVVVKSFNDRQGIDILQVFFSKTEAEQFIDAKVRGRDFQRGGDVWHSFLESYAIEQTCLIEEREAPPMADPVNHPRHYNTGKIEVIAAIEDWGLGFHLGNTVKYVARAGKKFGPDDSRDAAFAKEIEDLEKAAWYLARKIESLKKERGASK
jgi:Protein of unknwon function (DUF3310)